MIDETAWILDFILQWVLLSAPAVALRKYRRRPMNKTQAIVSSGAIGVFWVFVGVMFAHELGIEPLMSGAPINTAPIALSSFISFLILRKVTVLDGDTSLKMSDRVFKKIFPETNTSHPAEAQRGQHSQAAEKKRGVSNAARLDQFGSLPKKASPSHELNMTTTPEIDEDALYEQAVQ
jgi:hypothetical protein